MGLTKSEIFTEKQNQIAMMAKALGHPARIAIIQHLIEANACICGEIVGELGLAQATVSQHLKELKTAGFIKGTIEGTSVSYCINTENWNKIKEIFGSFFDVQLSLNDNDCC
ncbi:ArsR/SmtB family transcription factor [Reichenbachiella versicolor]|uniref:ArsR/SmtB family transcription factor n=1 Tax=Reichenbachiella versicolor TaxID=1821036 RepID=UPI000D6E7F4B|nr:metalloregulator ArsR/SmtB family transcription factor [Reichenbachiella versicolor]